MFIQKGGIDVLIQFLTDEHSSTFIKEETIWALTNLSYFSGLYEAEFAKACIALLSIIRTDKIENLGSLLNLKQQALQTLGNFAIDSKVLREVIAG